MIPEEHMISIDSAVRQHPNVTRPALIDLYNAAISVLKKEDVVQRDILPSMLTANNPQFGDLKIGTATDQRTGVFVQMADAGGKLLMTIGQKWAVQQPNAQGTLVTAHW